MKLVTFDDGKVGRHRGRAVVELDVPDMRTYYERGQVADETGETFALADVRLRAPIVPKKFFHTAGNFREHHEESKNVNWSHPVLPWIVFFQNIDAIIGTDDAIVYPPDGLTNEIDYELELAVVIGKAGKFFSPEEAEDYIAGYLIFNDITARDIQREEMKSGVFCLSQEHRHLLPDRPVDRHPRRGRRRAEPRDGAARQRRVAPGLPHQPHVGDDPGDHQPLLADGLLPRRHHLHRHRLRRGGLQRRPDVAVPQARRRGRVRDRERRRPAQPGRGLRPTSRARLMRWDDQEFTEVRPGIFGATIDSDAADGRPSTATSPGCAWETHAHPEDQVTSIAEGGTVDFVVDGRPAPMSPGELAVIPGGVPHSATVAADGERVISVNVWRLRASGE